MVSASLSYFLRVNCIRYQCISHLLHCLHSPIFVCVLAGVLAGDLGDAHFSFLCSTSSGSNVDVREIVWSHEPVGEPAKNFTDDLAHQLVFDEVEVSDDGLYLCYYTLGTDTNFIRSDAGCIYVFGELSSQYCIAYKVWLIRKLRKP